MSYHFSLITSREAAAAAIKSAIAAVAVDKTVVTFAVIVVVIAIVVSSPSSTTDAMRMSILVDILLNRKTILTVVGQGVCRYVLIFSPMDGPTYTVEWQTESYVTRYVGMSLFWPPMDDA